MDETDIGLIKGGQTVDFTVQSYPDDQFLGTVSQIRMNPTEESNVVTYTVIVDAQNKSGKLLPGMTATADFSVEKAQNTLLIPNAALTFKLHASDRFDQEEKDEPGVYVFEERRPKWMPVSTGITDGTSTAIDDDNLTEGDRVITGKVTKKSKSKGNLMSKIFPKPFKGKRPPPM